jgi:FxsC-like protein
MVAKDSATETPAGSLPYFFLSYAHSPSIAEYPGADPDRWVRKFFGDLVVAVRRHASPQPELTPGFFDQAIPVGSGWNESLSQALRTAQVFVPLYSVRYFAKSWPRREMAFFHERMKLAGLANPDGRSVPVLWAPLPETQNPPGLRQALALGAGEPGYAENGLQALLKIRSYHDSYQAVVDGLAKRIVVLAEKSPIGASERPGIDEMSSAFPNESRLAVFSIETAAPGQQGDRLAGMAGYAGEVVERFDFQAEISKIKTVSDPGTRRPGIILIDPWFIADPEGRSALESAVSQLPRWVLPLLIVDHPDDSRTQELAGQVRDILGAAGALPTDSSRQAAQGVSSFDAFAAIIPRLVAEAERQYLRYRSGRYRSGRVPSPQVAKRPSLRRPVRPDEPASTADPLGETPDA